ncbi:MAG: hypothetical protein HOP29_05410 [Phycisphaerales bacterium]|nr:hypothetical protein [Phycisphaerales bacterium]
MTGEQLVKHIKAQPFKPFRMYLADGREVPVGHPELVLYIPGTRTCVVADLKDNTYDTIDLFLVASIKVGATGNGGRRRKRG